MRQRNAPVPYSSAAPDRLEEWARLTENRGYSIPPSTPLANAYVHPNSHIPCVLAVVLK